MTSQGGDCVLKSGEVIKEDAFQIENPNMVCGLIERTVKSRIMVITFKKIDLLKVSSIN